jgi:site-specific DNA recombinase
MTTPIDTATTPRGREYLRVSHDTSGRARSLDEQMADNRSRWTGELALNGESYSDAAIPASRFSTRVRGGYDALVSDIALGHFGADVLVLWESSRGSRRVGEWATLLDLCEDREVHIAVTTEGRIYDPANPRDRRSLLEDAVDSEYEVAKTSARVCRAMNANAAEGRPHGRVAFGYRRIYDPVTRRLAAQEEDPETAPIVRELFDRLRQGHSLKSIARDFAARGITNQSAKPFTPQHLRVMARAELYDGRRRHHGELTEATWPALVDHATFLAVQRLLEDPARRTTRSGRAKHLLSFIGRCDECGGPLAAERRSGQWRYRCTAARCVTVDRDELDKLVGDVIVAYLKEPEHVGTLTADDGADAALDAARADTAQARAELEDLADQVGAGKISATLAARAEPQILDRIRAAEAREAELTTPSKLRALITPGEDVARRWAQAPIEARRDIARLVCSADYLGELRISRGLVRGSVEDRVDWRR